MTKVLKSAELSELISLEDIIKASVKMKEIAIETPFLRHRGLSNQFECNIFLKREDMQVVRSFKIRGAYNLISSLSEKERQRGVICASAGNHAQGVALSCATLKIKGKIFMPNPTPNQKINRVKHFGGEWVEVVLMGDNFDAAHQAALNDAKTNNQVFIHPFDDEKVIAGQGTIAKEMLDNCHENLDILLVAVGGGGLISGVGSYFKQCSPHTKIIAVEAEGAPALFQSLQAKKRVSLQQIDNFADGIAVRSIGDKTFAICQEIVDQTLLVSEGAICSSLLKMYNEEAIVLEPAGAVSIAALDQIKSDIKGKNVAIILCGGNNDVNRTEEIKERALLHEGKKHYFIVNFPQRAGALREFLDVLGPHDDIAHFSYTKKSNKAHGPALVGIELSDKKDYNALIDRMKSKGISFQTINDNPILFDMLV